VHEQADAFGQEVTLDEVADRVPAEPADPRGRQPEPGHPDGDVRLRPAHAQPHAAGQGERPDVLGDEQPERLAERDQAAAVSRHCATRSAPPPDGRGGTVTGDLDSTATARVLSFGGGTRPASPSTASRWRLALRNVVPRSVRCIMRDGRPHDKREAASSTGDTSAPRGAISQVHSRRCSMIPPIRRTFRPLPIRA
jgi:hypothetical protein